MNNDANNTCDIKKDKKIGDKKIPLQPHIYMQMLKQAHELDKERNPFGHGISKMITYAIGGTLTMTALFAAIVCACMGVSKDMQKIAEPLYFVGGALFSAMLAGMSFGCTLCANSFLDESANRHVINVQKNYEARDEVIDDEVIDSNIEYMR